MQEGGTIEVAARGQDNDTSSGHFSSPSSGSDIEAEIAAFIAKIHNPYNLEGNGMDMGNPSSGRSIFPKDSAYRPATAPKLGPSAAQMLNEIDRPQPGLPGSTKQGRVLQANTVR